MVLLGFACDLLYLSDMLKVLLLSIFFASRLSAQFADVSCDLDVNKLKGSGRQAVQGLQGAIEQFFSYSNWDRDVSDLGMALEIQVVFLPSVTIGGNKYFQSQILLSNRQDQVYFIKDAKFLYSSGRSIQLSSTYDPLGALLEFYAYLMIAGELDTYEQLGGSKYYSMASTLAQLSRSAPDLGKSWNARVEFADRLSSNLDLRMAKAYFYQAFGALGAETPNMPALAEAMDLFFKSIERAVLRYGIERHTNIFLSGHAEEAAEMFAMSGMKEQLSRMIDFNPNSERIYAQFLQGMP